MGALERITVEVPAEAAEALRRSVAHGDYASPDEIVAMALEQWIDVHASQEHRLEHLRELIDEGDASGPSIPAEQVYAELEAIIASYERKS